ncbi:hypothetical protein F7734_31365 [Scytonema sp. UIC 10036]|uniref:hypothetical protein n=1 Tax=Scytonema sp. UIC 10036 TaxID=2304196 RepID=UPI0012DA997A|nr:hypothetical protein [Scytonema sp. UIC 10036]MUG96595.1 hypothetical protein [Scytonema sp. UIC 10036]
MQAINSQLAPYAVTGTLGFEELAIALVANQFASTTLQMDFLKMSGIIPPDWELQKQPILTATVSQLTFKNGVNIVAQARTITFTQTLDSNSGNTLQTPALARQFVEKLPNADYQGISINPKILIAFPEVQNAARKFITQTLLSPGLWNTIGVAPVQAAVNFFYQLERCKLLVNLNEAQVQQPDKTPISALLFSGNFNYEIGNYGLEERLQQMIMRLENFSTDVEDFRAIVSNKFLGQQKDNVFQ